MRTGYGFKILDPTGATYYRRSDRSETYHRRSDRSDETLYALPRPGEKWGPWIEHLNPAEFDGKSCGPGRFHLHKRLSFAHAPAHGGWPWFAQWEELIGEDSEKIAVRRLRLRRIAPCVLWRALCPPFNWGYKAYLHDANLRRANLHKANLWRADLSKTDLRSVDLSMAYLSHADLSQSDLGNANLSEANLSGASLYKANLHKANLSKADLRGANLRRADLRWANLCEANLTEADLTGADLGGVDMCQSTKLDWVIGLT